MRTALVGLVLVGLIPAYASAQDGLRSASLPERTLSSSRLPQEDGYRARPDTYRPNPRRLPVLLPPLWGYYGAPIAYPTPQPIIVVQVHHEPLQHAGAPPLPVPPPAPYVGGTPGRPKTFYVIPGCYAGDRRPEPESLAADCSLSRLRVIPPHL